VVIYVSLAKDQLSHCKKGYFIVTVPLVSVCIPLYNGAKYIAQCLQSILNQSYQNFEIIVVDDCSMDNSLEIIQTQFKDARIKVFLNEKNLGLVGNWNKCIKYAKGEWIKFIFQDDYVSEDMLRVMMQYASPENKFIVCNREFVFEEGVSAETENLYKVNRFDLAKIFKTERPTFISSAAMSKMIAKWRYRNYIGEPTVVLFHKSVVKEIGLFSEMLGQICDLEYWFRLASAYGLFYIPQTLASFRVHNEATSAKNRKDRRELIDYIVMLCELLFGKKFESFRRHINKFDKYLMELTLKRQVQVITVYLKASSDVKMEQQFDVVKEKFPQLEKFGSASIVYYLLMPFIYIRRLIFRKFGVTIG
jgi:glycosyltransferase involved in cell wall biosynthesis